MMGRYVSALPSHYMADFARPILYRQVGYRFYRPAAFVCSFS